MSEERTDTGGSARANRFMFWGLCIADISLLYNLKEFQRVFLQSETEWPHGTIIRTKLENFLLSQSVIKSS